MSKNQIEKFVRNSLDSIQTGLPNGFRIDDKINFDIALITQGKTKGEIDIKLASVGSDIASQTVHRIRFSVVDEEAQKKSWKLGKEILGQILTSMANIDQNTQLIDQTINEEEGYSKKVAKFKGDKKGD